LPSIGEINKNTTQNRTLSPTAQTNRTEPAKTREKSAQSQPEIDGKNHETCKQTLCPAEKLTEQNSP